MPTYTISTSNIKLSSKQKHKIAQEISQAHNKITGANIYFSQVIFNEIKKNNHFIGSKIVNTKKIFLHGEIRAGRTAKMKKELINYLRDTLLKNSIIQKDNIWIYLLDLLPEQMIEHGEVLPKSGKEKKWFARLSLSLQKKLKKYE